LVALEQEEAGGFATLERTLGDLRLGKMIIEVIEAHEREFSRNRGKAKKRRDLEAEPGQ
jgi:hypothetical protein